MPHLFVPQRNGLGAPPEGPPRGASGRRALLHRRQGREFGSRHRRRQPRFARWRRARLARPRTRGKRWAGHPADRRPARPRPRSALLVQPRQPLL